MVGDQKEFKLMGLTLAIFMAFSFAITCCAQADEKEDLASEVANIFKGARKVVADNQTLINDASKGDKGLTADKVIEDTKTNYKAATGADFVLADAATLKGQAQQAMLEAVKQVMISAQPLINEQGKGFKGFLPAIFGKNVADAFSSSMAGKVFIKLTAPKAFVRNRANRPDDWEDGVIENKFKSSSWEKGKAFSEKTTHKEKQALRLILPEYYGEACLQCHGEPQGEIDITGGAKEGAKLGDLGGAISVAIYE